MSISRRDLIKTMGALSVVKLTTGCNTKDYDTNIDIESSGEPSSETGGPDDPIEEGGRTANGWLIGGTTLITAAYPDDSIFDDGGNCEVNLTGSTTKGPCYFQDSTGEDISEGFNGLPMLLCLRLI